MQLNSNQVEVLQNFRSEWVGYQKGIDSNKESQKGLFESLWEALNWDKKEHAEDIKAVKAGFSLYYKDNAAEAEKHVEEAVIVAGL